MDRRKAGTFNLHQCGCVVCSRLPVALAVTEALEVALDTESVEGPLVSITIKPTTCSIIILVLDLGMGFLLLDLEEGNNDDGDDETQQTKTKDNRQRQEIKEKYERQQTKEKGRRLLGGLRTLEGRSTARSRRAALICFH